MPSWPRSSSHPRGNVFIGRRPWFSLTRRTAAAEWNLVWITKKNDSRHANGDYRRRKRDEWEKKERTELPLQLAGRTCTWASLFHLGILFQNQIVTLRPLTKGLFRITKKNDSQQANGNYRQQKRDEQKKEERTELPPQLAGRTCTCTSHLYLCILFQNQMVTLCPLAYRTHFKRGDQL